MDVTQTPADTAQVAPQTPPTTGDAGVSSAPASPSVVTPASEVKVSETLLGAEPAPVATIEAAPSPEKAQEAAQNTDIKAPVEGELSPDSEKKGDQSDEPAPLPVYDAWELPEGFSLDPERAGVLSTTLGEFEHLTKAEHAEVQKLGQKMIEIHTAEIKSLIERMETSKQVAFDKQCKEWLTTFEGDPEIGGNRKETSLTAAREFIRTHGGTQEQQSEFRQLMDTTGVGNHPALIRLLAAANSALAEGRPLPGQKPISSTVSKVQKRYGSE